MFGNDAGNIRSTLGLKKKNKINIFICQQWQVNNKLSRLARIK